MRRMKTVVIMLLLLSGAASGQVLYQPGTLATSFSAISAAGTPGTAFALTSAELSFMNMHTFQVIVSAQPTSIVVNLEGSLDNVNWFPLATISSVDGSWITGQGELVHVTYKPVRFLRCNATAFVPSAGSKATCQFISGRQ